jgi:hypothetical protein
MALHLTAALAMLVLCAMGCKQGVGDRCQINSDCDTGLVCVLPAGGSPAAGGTCQPSGQLPDGGTADAKRDGVTSDVSPSVDRGQADVARSDVTPAEARPAEARPAEARIDSTPAADSSPADTRVDSHVVPPDATPPDTTPPDAN